MTGTLRRRTRIGALALVLLGFTDSAARTEAGQVPPLPGDAPVLGANSHERRRFRVQDMRRKFDYFENEHVGLSLDPLGEGKTPTPSRSRRSAIFASCTCSTAPSTTGSGRPCGRAAPP